MNRRCKDKKELQSLTTLQTQDKENSKYITVEYNKNTANIIHKAFKLYKYNIGYRTTNKLTKYINDHSMRKEMATGVYKLTCKLQ